MWKISRKSEFQISVACNRSAFVLRDLVDSLEGRGFICAICVCLQTNAQLNIYLWPLLNAAVDVVDV